SGVVAVAGADAEQRHVVQYRIGPEEADIAAGHDRAPTAARRQEYLADIQASGAERGMSEVRVRNVLQVRAAPVIGADARVQAERESEIDAILRGRATDGE